MDPEELKNLREDLEELTDRVETMTKDNQTLKDENKELWRVIESHTHSGNDRTKPFYRESFKLKTGSQMTVGYMTMADDVLSAGDIIDGTQRGNFVIGQDEDATDGNSNSQITIEHQKATDGGTNQTFVEGIRGLNFGSNAGGGSITNGGTTLAQNKFTFRVNSLAGLWLSVYNPSAPGQFDVYEIASNTATGITITGGTWTFTNSDANFFVYGAIYMGSADFPWRRLYTKTGTAGGIRFGEGDTNGGQNGLLYKDAAGDLYWRNHAGTSVKIN